MYADLKIYPTPLTTARIYLQSFSFCGFNESFGMEFAVIVKYNQLVAVDVAMWEHNLLEGLDNQLTVNFGVQRCQSHLVNSTHERGSQAD